MEMPFEEYSKWEKHLAYYPLPGIYEQHLLASLIAVQINTKEKKHSVYDIAPWLETPDIKEQRDKSKTEEQVAEASIIYEDMKKRKKNGS